MPSLTVEPALAVKNGLLLRLTSTSTESSPTTPLLSLAAIGKRYAARSLRVGNHSAYSSSKSSVCPAGTLPRSPLSQPPPANSSAAPVAPDSRAACKVAELVFPPIERVTPRTIAPLGKESWSLACWDELPPLKYVVRVLVRASSPSMSTAAFCARITRSVPGSERSLSARAVGIALRSPSGLVHGTAKPPVQSSKAFSGATRLFLPSSVAVSPLLTRSWLPAAFSINSPCAQYTLACWL